MHRDLSQLERRQTLRHRRRLKAAVQRARDEGWEPWERDVIAAEARALGVRVWPALIEELVREVYGRSSY